MTGPRRPDASAGDAPRVTSSSPTVYKLGGSLFDLPGLRERLADALRPDPRPLIVCGGGAAADAVRGWDRVHGLGEKAAHRLACESLGLTARFVSELLGAALVGSRDAAGAAWARGRVAVLDTPRFLECEEPRDPHAPPHSWATTADTLAAWVARRWPAGRLVLWKSCDARPGAVDPHFATYAAGLRVEWANLRAGGLDSRAGGFIPPEGREPPVRPPTECGPIPGG